MCSSIQCLWLPEMLWGWGLQVHLWWLVCYKVNTEYRNESIYSNHPIIQTPPFSKKHPCLKLLFQYPNTYTLRSFNEDRWTSTSLRQSHRGYSEGYRTSSSILQAYSNAYLTTKVVSKYLLDSYCHCRAQSGVLAFDSFCGARTGVAKWVLAFDSLCRARKGGC